MRFFFRSKQFKIILTILLSLLAVSIIFSVIGGAISPQSNIIGTITAPFRSAITAVKNGINDFSEALSGGNEVMLENAELEAQINETWQNVSQRIYANQGQQQAQQQTTEQAQPTEEQPNVQDADFEEVG